MVAGDLVQIINCQTTGFDNGEIGLITYVEDIGLHKIYWVMIKGVQVPFWENEIGVFNGPG